MSIDHIVPALDPEVAAELRTALAQSPTVTLDGSELPLPVQEAVLELLALFGEGQSVAFGPVAALLTTSQAAEILGVSDTYVRRLADSKTLPIEMRGTHRRFRLSDVMDYRDRPARPRSQAQHTTGQ
ncbi:MerR family transcriptional regulator [Rhodococcus sp. WMMA185]|uniref:helix-turn-helix domain-containing protein n=1 Tax=Rhodococcus sp. WMMA185 TaxID=679318 RepID=UPI0008784BFB|nr:helix-turn-helix domain-containing protein [Rhodococcus sp. WMMA185]AOW93101.1 MerR family transcriptional regulator [Rhodococcus sp. WMMA185]